MATVKTKSNVSKATFLSGYDEYASSMGEQDRLKSQHQTLCKKLKSQGIEIAELKESYKLARMDREHRETHYSTIARYAAWLEKPIGFQANLVDAVNENPTQDDIEAAERHALAEAYQSGYAAGKSGAGDAFCSFEPGTERYQQYMLGVGVGQKLHNAKPKKEKKASTGGGRGRPRKDANKNGAGLQSETPGDSSVQSHTWSTGDAAGTA